MTPLLDLQGSLSRMAVTERSTEHPSTRVQALGFYKVQRIWGLGFRLRTQGPFSIDFRGFRVWGGGFKVVGVRFS